MTSLRNAILSDDLETVKAALPLDPSLIDEADENGASLALLAAWKAGFPMLRYLVEYGLRVNLNAVDGRGRDLLHYAAMSGSEEKCRYLIEQGGMDPLRADNQLITPYDLAHESGSAALIAYLEGVVGTPLSGMYRNPICRGMHPDPSIVRVGEDYYMVNSTFIFFPCIPISHSRDLVHWEVVGHAIENPAWAHLEGLEGGRGYWAPDISYSDGRFYICATLRMNDEGYVRRRQMVVTSEKAEGPYSEPVFFDEDGIDPALFHDDDGRHYMLINRGARIFEIDAAATRRLSHTQLIHYGSHGRAPEGPHLLKRDGWYYLFLAEGGTGMGHRETVARSRALMGPYTPSPYGPVIRQWDERALIQRCGHADAVCTPDGNWYFVFLCGRALDGKWTMLGRETALQAFRWTEDGWPVLCGRGIASLAPLPLPEARSEKTRGDWVTPRPPAPGEIAWTQDAVTIRGSAYPMTDVRCRSMTLMRQTEFACAFSAVLTVPPCGEAGITGYYDEHSFYTIGVRRGDDGFCLRVYEQRGEAGREVACEAIDVRPGDRVALSTQADGLARSVCIRWGEASERVIPLENVTYLSDEGVTIGKRFTGAMLGMYALGGCEASFDTIFYQAATDQK